MEKTLTELCEYMNNYFWVKKWKGNITISGGTFVADYLKEGQYFRIVGSVFPENNGVHKYPANDLKDEKFIGQIWSMAVPQAVIDLANDIKIWQDKYGSADSAAMSPFNSESFGIYNYSKDSGSSSDTGVNANSWQALFATRMSPYRRLRGIP